MKHIVILDDHSKRNKAFLEIARAMNDIRILTPARWEKLEDEYAARQIKKGLATGTAEKKDVKKALQKLRA